MHLQIALPKPSDLPAVLELLEAVQLPTEGVAEQWDDFLIARANERVVGCVGLERYSSYGLLRSLAVAPENQGQGLGKLLTTHLITYAQANATSTLVLLTTTAESFFAQHFGFAITDRNQFNDVFAASPEWSLPRCASAVCMVLTIST